jgi:hypothetical protein
MKVAILGTEYECRALSPADRLQWNLYLYQECLRTFYSDLHTATEDLPTALQEAIFRKHSPPRRLDRSMPLYYRLATTPPAVRVLLEMVLQDEAPEVTSTNATEILLAVRHLIFTEQKPVLIDTKEKQAAAAEIFAALEGESHAGE